MIYNDGTFEENGELWFVGNLDNKLYHMNRNGEVGIVTEIPFEGSDTYRINPICLKSENKIICLPDKGKSIMIYDLEKRKFDEIRLQIDALRYTINNGWIVGNTLWCMTYRTGELIKCNLDSKAVEKKIVVCDGNAESAGGEVIRIDEKLYFISLRKCEIVEFNLIDEEKQVFEIKCNDEGFGTILNIGDNFYLTGHQKHIYVWNIKEKRIDTIEIGKKAKYLLDQTNRKTTRFSKSVRVKDYIIFIPTNDYSYVSNDVVAFNVHTKEIKTFTLENGDRVRKPGKQLVLNKVEGNKVLIQDYMRTDYWELDIETGEVNHREMLINAKENETFWKHNGVKGCHVESAFIHLEDFISNI